MSKFAMVSRGSVRPWLRGLKEQASSLLNGESKVGLRDSRKNGMKSGYSNLNTEESESDFRRLLQDIQASRVPAEVLFEDQIFKTRHVVGRVMNLTKDVA